MTALTITQPDDWHLHIRDGDHMASVIGFTAKQFGRAIIMPNLNPPVTTTAEAQAYRDRILAALPAGSEFQPLMTLYLTDNTTADEIRRAKDSGIIHGVKLYPAGATTNAENGVTDWQKTEEALAEMERVDLPLQVHGEVTDPSVDVFDREKVFIEQKLNPITETFPNLRVVFEHITTRDAVEFVTAAGDNIGATMTPQHLLLNRNAMLVGGIHPHHYCLPVLKRERHRESLVDAATSGNPKFFLGTDSAPHTKGTKESSCGCAGIFSAHAALELYAQAFEQAGALDKLEGFASFFGADFYGLPRNQNTVTLVKEAWQLPEELPFADQTLVPFFAGDTLEWKLT
ncbi:dihydroorotase [Kaarinaea lacus]